MSKKKPKLSTVVLKLCDRGETCPRRGIPLVDVYLSGEGEEQGCWMHGLGLSVPFAESVAAWFREKGAAIDRQEASSDPEHSRDLFSGFDA